MEAQAHVQAVSGGGELAARKKQLAGLFIKASIIISPGVLEELSRSEAAYEDAVKLSEYLARHNLFILGANSLALWRESVREASKVIEPVGAAKGEEWTPRSASLGGALEISIGNSDVTDQSRCKGTVNDFVAYFSDRFARLSEPLKMMSTKSPITRIRDAQNTSGKNITIIGMVASRKVTKNGHMLFEIEDMETLAPVLVPKDSPLMARARDIVEDEVVSFEVYNSKSLLIAKSFNQPGKILQHRTKRLASRPAKIALISDLHIGSRWFLQQNFQRFLQFLNGRTTEEEREMAEDIKYLSIAGDLVDGIGVYPKQERELVTKDIFAQYGIFCDFLKQIPGHVEVIIIPGNHDAVRVAEPQPAIPLEFIKGVQGMDNLHFAGNPSTHKVEGLTLLTYHGTSVDGLIANSPGLRDGYENPQKVAVEMLNKRHLCPKYGEDSIVPEPRDYLALDYAPDIFHFGHVHRNGYVNDYNGTVIINSGTFQAQTDYQSNQGHIPTPCKVPIYGLDTGIIDVIDFGK